MNTDIDNGIKKCNKCANSKEFGAVFGFSKPYKCIDGTIIRYENLVCNKCLSLAAQLYRKNNINKTRETKKKRRDKLHGTIIFHVQNKIASYKREAIKNNLQFDLTIDYLVDLYNLQNGNCFYSKEKLIFGYVDGKIHHNTLSLDKLDPSKGYIQGNVVWCSYLVNTMKQNMTKQEFYDFMKKLLDIRND